MKAFEEKFPKPDLLYVYYYPDSIVKWESKKEGWKEALEWVLEYIESPNEFKFCLTEDKIKKELEQ